MKFFLDTADAFGGCPDKRFHGKRITVEPHAAFQEVPFIFREPGECLIEIRNLCFPVDPVNPFGGNSNSVMEEDEEYE